MLYWKVCPPGGPDTAAIGLHLHDLQPAALLSRWTETKHWPDLPASLANGGPHRGRPLCKYLFFYSFVSFFILDSDFALCKLVNSNVLFLLGLIEEPHKIKKHYSDK